MKQVIALVGMAGAGKSQASDFFKQKNIPVLRFGDITDEGLKAKSLPITEENEKAFRENLRKEFGMEAYAIRIKQKIDPLLEHHEIIVLDGLYSWEEYLYLLKSFPQLMLVCIYAATKLRYERLAKRAIRPLSPEQARQRDIAEIENLHKGGPIAIADYLIKNEISVEELHQQLEVFLTNINK